VKTANARVKEDEVEIYSKTGPAENVSSKDKKTIIKEEEGEAENQDIEGNHIKEGDKLDKNIKETSSEKPVHSFFGNCHNYHLCRQLHVMIYSGGAQFKYSESCSVVFLSLFRQTQ
jgi:hypothetical protein